jgi:RimJ/RimL family protein N-acetyltransferase
MKDPIIAFKPINHSDFEQLDAWIRVPHVAKWWYPDILPWNEFVTKYTQNLDSSDIEGYLILIDDRSVGYIQGYHGAELPDEEGVSPPVGTWGMDLYIADTHYLGKGFGPKILNVFMEKLQKEHTIKKFIIDPHVDNKIAIRTYEKVGFKAIKEADQSYGKVLIMEKDADQNIKPIHSINFHVFKNLAQAYEAEFSNLTHKVPDEHGVFKLDTLPENPYIGFLMYDNDHPVGFAILNVQDEIQYVAEFYIIPSMRNKKLGQTFAFALFKKFPGFWQIQQIEGATKAILFWRSIISKFTNNDYSEEIAIDEYWGRVTRQSFSSK